MIYLYVKTHNVTGLKYLGKTTKNPYTYKGSGTYWLRHIKTHGYDVTTEIVFQSENLEEVKTKGIYYSAIWNVVESTSWANLIVETASGGDTSLLIDYKLRNSTNNSKYGVDCVFQSDKIINKMKETRLKKYGVEWASQSSIVQETTRENNKEKYGVDSPNKLGYRKDQVRNHNKYLADREVVKNLRILKKATYIKELTNGWYKKPTKMLEEIYLHYCG